MSLDSANLQAVSPVKRLTEDLPNRVGRIPELDGIRGIAIGLVIAYHYFFMTIAARPGSHLAYALTIGRLSWSGVDLFFVLSGFLIGGILLDARQSSNYFRVFYTRRFYRIVPLYALWYCSVCLTLAAIRSGIAPESTWFLKDSLPMYPYAVFLQNFWMAAHNNLGGASSGGTWSLAIEEQFYLTLPLIIRFHDLARRPLLVLLGVVSAPALRILLFLHSPHNSIAPFALMPCRADSLLLGVFAALLIRDESWKERLENHRRFLQLLLAVLLAGAAYLTVRNRSYSFLMISIGYTWIAGLYVRPLLYHVFGLRESVEIIDSIASLSVSIAAIPITLLICRLSWAYFEKPLMQIGHRAKYKPSSIQSD
jgi:peptidoglycan/LPS O-acetylase OafA/YrhL